MFDSIEKRRIKEKEEMAIGHFLFRPKETKIVQLERLGEREFKLPLQN